GDGGCAGDRIGAHGDSERWTGRLRARAVDVACRGDDGFRGQREPVIAIVFEVVRTLRVPSHLFEEIVHERKQLRYGAEAARDGTTGSRLGAKTVDEAAGLL